MRTSSDVISSRDTAAFRTVLAKDARGLPRRFRLEIMTLRRLNSDRNYAILRTDLQDARGSAVTASRVNHSL
jgi:hypothetical protein